MNNNEKSNFPKKASVGWYDRSADQLAICYFTIKLFIIFRRSSRVEIPFSCGAELFRDLLLLVNSYSGYNNAYSYITL